MDKVRWSALILAELTSLATLPGCMPPREHAQAQAPRARHDADPAVAPPPVVPLPDPPGTQKGAAAFVELSRPDRVDAPLPPEHVQQTAFGRGLFAQYSAAIADRPAAPCPFATTGDGCRFFRVAPLSKPLPLTEALQPLSVKQVGPWGKPTPVPHDWSSFGAGRDRVYAVRRGDLTIDVVDERGVVAPFFTAGALGGVHDVRVVEGAGVVFVLAENDAAELVVASVKLDANGKAQGALSPWVALPVKVAPPWATARWVRNQGDANKRVAWGNWAAAPLGAGLALAFVGVSPPPKGAPRGGVREPKGAKHGCGRPSRPLADWSVRKSARLLALDARGVAGRELVVVDLEGAATVPRLDLTPLADGGVSLLGKAYSRDLAELGPSSVAAPAEPPPPPFAGAPLQTLDAIGFDPATGEGMLLAREEQVLIARTFDGLGRVTGEPRRLPGSAAPPRHVLSLARVGDAWLYLEDDGEAVCFVTGAHAGKRVEVPELSRVVANHTLGIFPWGDGRAVVARASNRREIEPRDARPGRRARPSLDELPSGLLLNARPSGLLLGVVDVAKGVVERPLAPADGWPRRDGDVPKMTTVIDAAVGAGGLVVVGLATSPSGESRAMALRAKLGTSAWEELELPTFPGVDAVTATPYGHDVVVVLSSPRERRAVWLASGEARAIPLPADERGAPRRSRGPLLADGALPPAPGELVAVPDLASLAACPAAVVTGPSRVVLGCVEHVEDGPSLRAGLRALRF